MTNLKNKKAASRPSCRAAARPLLISERPLRGLSIGPLRGPKLFLGSIGPRSGPTKNLGLDTLPYGLHCTVYRVYFIAYNRGYTVLLYKY